MTDPDAPTQAAGSASGDLAAAVEPPAIIAGRYEVRGLLGAGGMGRVYRALDRALDETVAIKVLRRELVEQPGVLERFRQEVRLARKVTSPHVVRTFDFGEHEDTQFLTMEYVEGRSLGRMIAEAPLELGEVLRIARAAAIGIAAAHAAGVLHRDLKPDNILVGNDGRVVITDFGIAMPSANPIAPEDRMIGTPAYMAPEQVEAAEVIGPPVDVYAFGAILFEMLTSRRAFPGNQAFAVAIARLHHPPPDPRDHRALPDSLAELTLRCLALAPGARYPDGAALERALAAVDAGARPAPAPAPPMVPGSTSTAVALLGLRAPADLDEIADGLAEEIVDALSMTRALLVRPLSAVRRLERSDDPRELGRKLDVDVVVDGSLRRFGETILLSARVIGVADGFQLWASKVETTASGLLAAGDSLARAIARALMVEIKLPARGKGSDPDAIEQFLEAKVALRIAWMSAAVAEPTAQIEVALRLAPDEPAIIATAAMANARTGWFTGDAKHLQRARELAERALALAPAMGEPWLALAAASFYTGGHAEAGVAARRALERAPNLVLAQAMLGGILLEVGALDEAIAHLEAAFAMDDIGPQRVDLSRAYVYAGRSDEARVLLAGDDQIFAEITEARFAMWRGEQREILRPTPAHVPGDFAHFARLARTVHGTRALDPVERRVFAERARTYPPRQQVSFTQMFAEWLLFIGDTELALDQIEVSTAAGLHDVVWIERCPMLAPLRDSPRFAAAAATVRARAEAVRRSILG